MGITLKLDASALNALFPEGYEARVELSHAVLNQAAQQYVKGGVSKEVAEYLTSHLAGAANMFDDAIRRQLRAYHSGKTVIGEGQPLHHILQESVKKALEQNVAVCIQDVTDKMVANALADLDARIQSVVDYKVALEINTRVDKRLKAVLAEAAKKAEESS